MTAFWQAVAAALMGAVLCTLLANRSKEMTALLSLVACCGVLFAAVSFLKPVLALIEELKQISGLDESLLSVLIKATGVGLTAELAATVCTDSGNSALAKAVELLAAGALLWLSVPLMRELLELVGTVVGGI